MDEHNPILEVRIISPRGVLFAGKAYSVSAKNLSGPFDVLPYHANFITFIEKSPIKIHKADGSNEEFSFPFAIMYNNKNKIDIYTEISHSLGK